MRYVISVGRLIRRKAFDRLILSLEHLPEDVGLLIVGDGPLRDELEGVASASNLSGRVRFAGYVSDEDKFRYLAAADLYVLSSYHEGFGLVLQEAMSAGLPIVATSHGGQTDIVEDGVNALLIDSNEPPTIAAAVRTLIGDAALRDAMARANREKVKQFDPSRIAASYVELFRGVVSAARTIRAPSARERR